MITDLDFKIVYQSHFRKITVLKKEKLSPHLLLGLLGMEIGSETDQSQSHSDKEQYLRLGTGC